MKNLSIYLSICLFYLSIHLSIYLSVCLCIYLSIILFIKAMMSKLRTPSDGVTISLLNTELSELYYTYEHLSIYPYLSIYPFIYPFIYSLSSLIIQKLEDAQRQLAAKQASLAEARAKLKEVKHYV